MPTYTITTTTDQEAILQRCVDQENRGRAAEAVLPATSPADYVQWYVSSWLESLIRREQRQARTAVQSLMAATTTTAEQDAAILEILKRDA